MKKSFYDWLTSQKKRDDPIGDLAEDVQCDKRFPQDDSDLFHCKTYLERMHFMIHAARGCQEAHVALDEAWEEYTTKKKNRQAISLKLRFQVFKRDGYACKICGKTVNDGVKLEIDHKNPVSKGGNSQLSNLWTLCFDCNRGKRDELL